MPIIRWIKTISILATVVLLSSTLACDSKISPSSPSVLPAPASGPASYTTAGGSAFHEFDELEEEEEEDNTSDDSTVSADAEDSCARGAGFYCQNQGGGNPNMSGEEFQMFAVDAVSLLDNYGGVHELSTPEGFASAVCDTSDQLIRNLATLALNLASGRINAMDPHSNDGFPTIEVAVAHAVGVANGSIGVTGDERKEVKRMLEQINGNVSINEGEECKVDDDGDDDDDPTDPESPTGCEPPDGSTKILVCHKGKTLSISPNAWPAHRGHGDSCSPCVG